MHKKIKILFIIFLLLHLTLLQAPLGVPISQKNITNQKSVNLIQDLIDDASNNDTIFIPSGTYYENLIINKSLSLIGGEHTIIDGLYQDSILQISADQVTIKNIHFRNSRGEQTDSGIFLNSNNISLINCVFYHSKQGIHLENNSNITIRSCLFYKLGRGINARNAKNLFISNCSMSHVAIGIVTKRSRSICINQSRFDTSGISIYLKRTENVDIKHSSVKDNSDNHGGIFIEESTLIRMHNSSIHHNGIGINVEQSKNITLKNLQITNNTHFGILLRKGSQNIKVQYCIIKNNVRYGIYCYDQTSSRITYNTFSNNALFGLYSINPVFSLKKNWWGSLKGPSISPFTDNDRVSINNYIIHFNKWSIQPYPKDSMIMTHCQFYNSLIVESPNLPTHVEGEDSDGDGAPDWWEQKWDYDIYTYHNHAELDSDNDGLTNIEECYTDKWGSNPFKKDVFLEIDWMESNNILYENKPSPYLLDKLKNNFKTHDITLHIDDGTLGEGGKIPNQKSSDFSSMVDIYWNNFLDNDLLNPRKGIFRYAIISDECADVSYPFIGWDSLDGIAISAEEAKHISRQYSRKMIIVGGILHQLGSTFGLLVETHRGNDNLQASKLGSLEWFTYRNYRSSMNYLYKYRVLSFSDGSRGYGDFNDWDHLNFSFFKDSSFSMQSD